MGVIFITITIYIKIPCDKTQYTKHTRKIHKDPGTRERHGLKLKPLSYMARDND